MPEATQDRFLHSQLNVNIPIQAHEFSGQTIVVTGSNTGLGLEAARHLFRLCAAKVILAVRSLPKGEAAKADIESSTGRIGVIEVHGLDLPRYGSVKKFAKQMSGLPRIDAAVANARLKNLEHFPRWRSSLQESTSSFSFPNGLRRASLRK